jgi:hypothetical protein
MFRKLALAIVPLALLAAACSGGDSADDGVQRDTSQPTAELPAAVSDGDGGGLSTEPTAAPAVEPPAAVGDGDGGGPSTEPPAAPSAEPPAAVSDQHDGSDGAGGEALFGALNPFDLIGGFDAVPGLAALNQDVDPSLEAPLIVAGDLPPEYAPLGEFAFSLPTEYGTVEMAASQFETGGGSSIGMASMVMSAVVSLPPEAMDELGDLSELDELTEADLAELQDLEGFGMGFQDFHILDASGLGDGGAGFHMEIDLAGLFDALLSDFGEEFGAVDAELSQEEIPIPDGIGMDAYMFVRGERMLMLMVMWPLGENPGVDARELADTMDGRAAAAF